MINPEKLKIEDLYREVLYVPDHGTPEKGVITSWTYKYIFVNYGTGSSKATPPNKLEWI